MGRRHAGKVSGKNRAVKITREIRVTHTIHQKPWSPGRGPTFRFTTHWEAKNLATGRTILIKSAQRLRLSA